MFSRDGVRFTRYMKPFLLPGPDKANWTKHSMMIGWGILQTARHGLSLYYLEHALTDSARLRRGTIRTDGFVSLHAPYSGGELVTKPLIFSGERLVLNLRTSAAGAVGVEIQDRNGTPVDGYRLEQCEEFYGDEIAHVVSWEKGEDARRLRNRPVRLRMVLKDADLYSIQFLSSDTK